VLNVSTAGNYVSYSAGYMMADLTVAHRVRTRLEALLQAQNVFDHYANDYHSGYATMGRQVKAGLRVKTL